MFASWRPKLRGDRASNPDRKTVAEWPGVCFDARHLPPVRMTVQRRERLHERRKVTDREKAAQGERRIERRGAMALAEDKSVPLRLPRDLRIYPKHGEEKSGESVRR